MLGQIFCRSVRSLCALSYLVDSAPVIVVRSFSSAGAVNGSNRREDEHQENSFMLSYLINSCGLSSESAVSASKYFNFESPEKPDSVLRLLRNHGFSDTDISRLIKRNPTLLSANPEKNILPKLEFLESIGVPRSDLGKIISQNPSILSRSLQNFLIPCHGVLKSLFPVKSDELIVKLLKRAPWHFLHILQSTVLTNVSALKHHGVSESDISQLVVCYPGVVALSTDTFDGKLKEVMEMGFNPMAKTFGMALKAVCALAKSTWESKMEVYKRWGLSQDEIMMAFKKSPVCMIVSEKKISSILDFLVNTMGWKPSEIAQVPVILSYSLEKRIIPRCSVIRVLLSKRLIDAQKQIFLSSVIIPSDKHFLNMFVTKFQDQVPELSFIFQGKMKIGDLGLGLEQKSWGQAV